MRPDPVVRIVVVFEFCCDARAVDAVPVLLDLMSLLGFLLGPVLVLGFGLGLVVLVMDDNPVVREPGSNCSLSISLGLNSG